VSTYIFDQAWHLERERLRALEDLHDEATFGRLAALGVGAGWRCLEVGGGAGSVARWLADRVGDTGHVLATDLDPRFMETDARGNLEVRRHDLLADPLAEGTYDLVHARAVLEHLPARELALARLVAATRPGGWVVIEDTFFGGAMVEAIVATTVPANERELFARVYRGLATLFAGRGARFPTPEPGTTARAARPVRAADR
jgi:SAM-dependent methyltransferase